MRLMAENDSTEVIGARLRKLRESGGVTAADLTRELRLKGHKVDRSVIANFEGGKRSMSQQFVVDYVETLLEIVERRARALGLLR